MKKSAATTTTWCCGMTGRIPCHRPLRPPPELHGAMQNQLTEMQVMVQELCRRSDAPRHGLPEELFQLFTDLLDSDLSEDLARELVERVRTETRARRSTTC